MTPANSWSLEVHSTSPVVIVTCAYVLVMCDHGHIWAQIEPADWRDHWLRKALAEGSYKIKCSGSGACESRMWLGLAP